MPTKYATQYSILWDDTCHPRDFYFIVLVVFMFIWSCILCINTVFRDDVGFPCHRPSVLVQFMFTVMVHSFSLNTDKIFFILTPDDTIARMLSPPSLTLKIRLKNIIFWLNQDSTPSSKPTLFFDGPTSQWCWGRIWRGHCHHQDRRQTSWWEREFHKSRVIWSGSQRGRNYMYIHKAKKMLICICWPIVMKKNSIKKIRNRNIENLPYS